MAMVGLNRSRHFFIVTDFEKSSETGAQHARIRIMPDSLLESTHHSTNDTYCCEVL